MSDLRPTLIARCAGKKPLRMGPGEKIRIGRHASNDLVLVDDTVSRFHAVIEWDPDEDRPFVVDNESANGVEVDGDLIEVKYHLPGGNQLVIGRFKIAIELTGLASTARAQQVVSELNDSDSVVLYTEKREQLTGRTTEPEELHRLLLDLEANERTGTLTVRAGALRSCVTFCQGVVMTAQCDTSSGRAALRELLGCPSAIYSFTRELRPVEDALNLSIRSYLESELSDMTKKLHLPRLDLPLSGEEPPTRSRTRREP